MTTPLIDRYHTGAVRLLGLQGLAPAAIGPVNRQAIDWLTALMLSQTLPDGPPPAEQTIPAATVAGVRALLSGGLIRMAAHINRLAAAPADPAHPVALYVHQQAIAMQEAPDVTRDTTLRVIAGHLALGALTAGQHPQHHAVRKAGS